MKFYLLAISLSIGCFTGILQTQNISIAETELSKTLDCTETELEAIIDQYQTREENLKRLSKQFFDSINEIEHCDREYSEDSNSTAQTNNAKGEALDNQLSDQTVIGSSDGKSPKGSMQNTQNADKKPPLENSNSSTKSDVGNPSDNTATASSSIIGTNLEVDSASAKTTAMPGMIGTAITPLRVQTQITQPNVDEVNDIREQPEVQLTNGKIPDDIPAGDNDSAFEAQIRAAAAAETNPEIQKNLWNEYRQYKGLPAKE